MSRIDLESMTIDELVALGGEVTRVRDEKIAAERERLNASLAHLAAIDGSPTKRLAAKYRSLADPSLVWAGRGSQPQFVRDHLAAGGTLEQLEVQ